MAVPQNSIESPIDHQNSSVYQNLSKNPQDVISTNISTIALSPTVSVRSKYDRSISSTVQSTSQVNEQRKSILEDNGYERIQEVGVGTYAKVITAYSAKEKNIVAIKIISKLTTSKTFKRKFLHREIDVVRGLNHRNIIRYYRSIETTHRIYIIMEYARNGSLLDMIRRESYFSEVKARHVYRQLFDALEYIHSRGIVHRDIKCENILFDDNNVLKIIDFGFASCYYRGSRGAMSETYCGSRAYCCPELLKQKPYNPQSADIWASGVVLFAMVYGKLPFDDSDLAKLLKQVQSKVQFPDKPIVSRKCQQLISAILAPFKKRATLAQINQFDWMIQNGVENGFPSD
ncbi:testis-specific serine/threonine-protein kinase 3-like [Bradysia coprophila]|uniref:testis-specific serine/threonine-protein kinase 3-like n=1 Tax=Bradysia coprophila TaxID=38358 RepID=UPI00187DCE91|nr:testis-specific serine/threonine-protein kinase 3-like [Bradysia coprophila]